MVDVIHTGDQHRPPAARSLHCARAACRRRAITHCALVWMQSRAGPRLGRVYAGARYTAAVVFPAAGARILLARAPEVYCRRPPCTLHTSACIKYQLRHVTHLGNKQWGDFTCVFSFLPRKAQPSACFATRLAYISPAPWMIVFNIKTPPGGPPEKHARSLGRRGERSFCSTTGSVRSVSVALFSPGAEVHVYTPPVSRESHRRASVSGLRRQRI